MPVLRDALERAGFTRVRTYLQSGNVVADGEPDALVAAIRSVIDVPCVVRTAAELDRIIAANPFGEEATAQPKAVQVTFRSEPPVPETLEALRARAGAGERVAFGEREVYTVHPDGVGRSDLARVVVQGRTVATSRNWNTVLALADLTHG